MCQSYIVHNMAMRAMHIHNDMIIIMMNILHQANHRETQRVGSDCC